METKYEKIKNIGKKALYAGVVGGTLAFGGCGGNADYNLPVSDEVRTEIIDGQNAEKIRISRENQEMLEKKVEDYQDSLAVARESFNEGVSDRKYTLEEQTQTYDLLSKGKYNDVKGFMKEKGLDYESVGASFPERRLYDDLNSNLSGVDFSQSDLEKRLLSERLGIKVDSKFTFKEIGISLVGFSFGLTVLGSIAKAVLFKSERQMLSRRKIRK